MTLKSSAIILVSFLICLAAPAVSSYYSDIEIISSDESGISFIFHCADPLKYSVSNPPDSAAIISRPVIIGIPDGAVVSISDARASKPQIPDPESMRYIRSSGKGLAEIAATRMVRGKKVTTLNIFPFYQNILYGQVEVTVKFERISRRVESGEAIGRDPLFEKVMGYSILNFDQFKSWPGALRRSPMAKAAQNPFEIANTWFKIMTSSEGLVKITGQNLSSAGLSLVNLYSDSLHLFYSGGRPLPVENDSAVPGLREIPIRVFDGGDGRFNLSDYLIFFSETADRWVYPSDLSPFYLENHYTGTNCYWLAASGNFEQGGSRMESIDGSPTDTPTPDTIITRTRFYSRTGHNNLLGYDSEGRIINYFKWFWTDQKQFTFYVPLPQTIPAESANVVLRGWADAMTLTVNDQPAAITFNRYDEFGFVTSRLVAGLNKMTINMNDGLTGRTPFFGACEIAYTGNLTPAGDVFDFSTNAIPQRGEMVIKNTFSATPYVLEVFDPGRPVMISGTAAAAGDLSFQYNLADHNRFYLCSPSKIANVTSIEKAVTPHLIESPTPTDMFIIAPRELIPELEDYRNYRAAGDQINVSLIAVEDIFNQFSYGMYDPTAIRNFLKYTYENYPFPPPSAVLLVGDGSYDYRNYLKTATVNLIPPYLNNRDVTASDDNYVYFGKYGLLDSDTSFSSGGRGYDMMIARWPLRNTAELRTVIDKVKGYEASTDYGPWRAMVTLVADDEFGTSNTESFHTRQAEELEKYHLPPAFRRNKIYLWDYPFDSNHQKPGVNADIIRSFNEGTLMINYIGHGNPDTWAHEHVFNRNTDLPQLHNADRLALILAASCSIGFFDDPQKEGLAEELLRLPGGGAIATLAATRLVYASANSEFNKQIFDILFGADSLSIGQSIFMAKLLRQYEYGTPVPNTNDRSYAFFGDPLLKLGVPHYKIRFSEIPDSLKALTRHDVTGEVVDKISGAHVNLDGALDLFVYDSEIKKTHKVVNNFGDVVDTVIYSLIGPMIYRGTTTLSAGNFGFSFIAPLDIGYGGKGAKISTYGFGASTDAFGLADSIPVSAGVTVSGDSIGPTIEYTFAGRRNFVSGDRIIPGDRLELTISDSSGLNLTGGSGHGIMLVIDNKVENVLNLTDLFQYRPGSYSLGEISYTPGLLAPGLHSFKVKAWDNANNSSSVEFMAEVLESGKLMIADLLNYPNPMMEKTTFSFVLSSPARKVSLGIFTLSGKKIMSYEQNSVSADYHEFFTWDGRDGDGDRVATGVYIYKLTALSDQSEDAVESFGKVVVVN